MALGVAVELGVGPSRQRSPQRFLRRLHAGLAVDGRMAAAEHDFGFPIEVSQELRLPAVPHAGADRANVGDGERQQHPEALLRLDDRRQRFRCTRIGNVAPLRRVRHDQVPLDEPSDVVCADR